MSHPMLRVLLMLISALPFAAVSASQDQANDQTRRLIRQIMLERRIPGLQIAVVRTGRPCCPRPTGWPTWRTVCLPRATPVSHSIRPPRRSPAWPPRSWPSRGSWIWTRRPRATWMIFRQRGETCAYTSCWRIPPAFRTSLMRMDCWAVAQKRRRGRPSLRSRSKPNPGSASPTTRPTTYCWHESSRSNPACPTNVSSPPASSAARAWPAPPSATATT